MSYYRKCKKCGRTIQLRQMPGGQWVAFEGYDQIHDCNLPVKKQKKNSKQGNDPSPSSLSDIVHVLKTAIYNNIVVELSYIDKDGNDTHRFIEPKNIDTTSIDAFCRLRKERRVFKLDHISSARLTKNHFSSTQPSTIKSNSYEFLHTRDVSNNRNRGFSEYKGCLIWVLIFIGILIIINYVNK